MGESLTAVSPRLTTLFVGLLIWALGAGLGAQDCPSPAPLTDGLAAPLATIRYLAADALEGRLAGSAGERCAGEYIARHFRRLGLEPAGDDGTYFQAVPLESAVTPHTPGGTGRNVVALFPGADPSLREEAVVIGAHYDHLGRGTFGSLDPDARGTVHNGADDNASGVAALLLAAEGLIRGPRPARSVVLVAFTGEELGLLGSSYYADHPTIPLSRTLAMLNLDMVGRLGPGPLIVSGTETAAEWPSILEDATRALGLPFTSRGEGYGPSDHTSFYRNDVPVLFFFTNTHEDYHRPSDDWEKIDARGVRQVAGLVTEVVRAVADRREILTLKRGAGNPPSTEDTAGYGAYLGSIPDFTPVDRGVRLAGVRAGSPAEQAGLRKGDILIQFNDREIEDLYALAEALRAHAAGDTVRVTLLRDGARLTVVAILGERPSEN